MEGGLETVDAGGRFCPSTERDSPIRSRALTSGLIATATHGAGGAANLRRRHQLVRRRLRHGGLGRQGVSRHGPGEQPKPSVGRYLQHHTADTPTHLAAWEAHNEDLTRRGLFNEKQYDALRYTGPGTDLTVGLPETTTGSAARLPRPSASATSPICPRKGIHRAPPRASRRDGAGDHAAPSCGNLIENFSLKL